MPRKSEDARGRVWRSALHAFDVLGVALVMNVAAHGVMAMPTPPRVFDTTPPNWVLALRLVAHAAGAVTLALHGLLARKLAR